MRTCRVHRGAPTPRATTPTRRPFLLTSGAGFVRRLPFLEEAEELWPEPGRTSSVSRGRSRESAKGRARVQDSETAACRPVWSAISQPERCSYFRVCCRSRLRFDLDGEFARTLPPKARGMASRGQRRSIAPLSVWSLSCFHSVSQLIACSHDTEAEVWLEVRAELKSFACASLVRDTRAAG